MKPTCPLSQDDVKFVTTEQTIQRLVRSLEPVSDAHWRDLEKRAALEQALKDKTMQLMTESINDPFKLAKFLNLIMALCKQELAFAVLSVSLLSDILDSATIPVCEQLFEFVEGHNTEAVLTVLKNIKLEWEPNTSVEVTKKHQTFFTKFLTNQKLLLLQLSDTDFTRTIYLQFLILFQFFSAQVKTKPKKGDEDVTEVIDMRQNYLQYLPGRNVSPNVHEFLAESIKQSENADMEAKEKKVNDPQFAWIALKLLSMKSPHFFSTNQDRAPPPTKLPDFVDHICRRIFREQNPGMVRKRQSPMGRTRCLELLLPPLHPAPKAVEAAKDQIVEKRQKVVKTANAKTVQGKAVGTAKAGDQAAKAAKTVKAPAPQNAEKAPVAKSDAKTTDKTEKLVKNDKQEKPDRIDRYEQNEKSERYEKGKSEKQEAAKLVKTEKAKTPVGDRSSTREKTIERKNDVEKNSVPKVSEKERTTPSRKERERSPGKRKREIDAVEIISNKKTARERRDDRRDEKNDDAPSLTTEQIEKLSKSISGSWKKVAEKLGFKSDDVSFFFHIYYTIGNRRILDFFQIS
ncbi:unnamed protein product [Nesidiocoris tenuis]|uniref:Uncharacterized protein n=1 Tax=Nesidiocoris tenuis TaxID=355587 RepID=A0A6H5GL34_9HEMI|nr:unnamed protein product [Nesidiocoris tenuis]